MTPDELIEQLGPSARNWTDAFSEHFEVTVRPGVPLSGYQLDELMRGWFQGAIEAGIRATDASYEVRCPWRWTNRLFYACAVLLALIAVITIWTGNWVCTLPYGLLAVESAVWPWLQNATYRFGYRHGWDRVAGWWPERKAAGDG
jgi:hypothetical protein